MPAVSSITDYTSLKNAVANWTHRPTHADLVTNIPLFISMFEDRVSNELRVAEMQSAFTGLSTSANTATVALPSDFLEAIDLQLTIDGIKREMKQIALRPLQLEEEDAVSSYPRWYSIVGSNLQLRPIPDGSYALSGTYYAAIPHLNDSDQTTNWLLTARPDIYLFGSLTYAANYLVEDNRLQGWQAFVADAIESLNRNDRQKRHKNLQYSSDIYRMQGRSGSGGIEGGYN